MTSHVNTFYLLDLDRTLFDTQGASDILIQLVDELSHELAQHIRSQIDAFNQIGASFAIRDVIVEQVGEVKAKAIEHAFITEGKRRSLLLEGAIELMADVGQPPARQFGIMTYGSVKGQTMKLIAAQLDNVPHSIIQQKRKGEVIATWQRDGGYQLPPELGGVFASELVFVDDRLFSFEGLPEDVTAYWVTQELALLDAVEHATNVHPVQSLTEVLEREHQRRN